jgi:methylmalonyl-CoA epimerase
MPRKKKPLEGLDHIGIAVADLAAVIKTLETAFDTKPTFRETVADQNVTIAGYRIGGTTIEYFEPLNESAPLQKFLAKRGNGIHHLAFRVQDLEERLKQLKSKGFRLIDQVPRTGAEGKKIAFLHPESFNGILIELCEY